MKIYYLLLIIVAVAVGVMQQKKINQLKVEAAERSVLEKQRATLEGENAALRAIEVDTNLLSSLRKERSELLTLRGKIAKAERNTLREEQYVEKIKETEAAAREAGERARELEALKKSSGGNR